MEKVLTPLLLMGMGSMEQSPGRSLSRGEKEGEGRER